MGLNTQETDGLRTKSKAVIAANKLPVFGKLLKQIDNEEPGFLFSLEMELEVVPSFEVDVDALVNRDPSNEVLWNPPSLPQQRRPLEPFAMLHSMRSLKIADVNGRTKYIDMQLMEDVNVRASRPPYGMEEVLDTSTKLKDQGNEGSRAGDFALAYSLYNPAIQNMEAGRRCLRTGIREGDFAGQKYSQAHYLLVFWIGSNSGAALLQLHQWMAAHGRATALIEGMRPHRWEETGFKIGEAARLYHRRALTSKGMGRMVHAIEKISEALRLDPNNTKTSAKLEECMLQVKKRRSKRR